MCVCSPCILGPQAFEPSGIPAGLNTEATRSQTFPQPFVKAERSDKAGVMEGEPTEKHRVSLGALSDPPWALEGNLEKTA